MVEITAINHKLLFEITALISPRARKEKDQHVVQGGGRGTRWQWAAPGSVVGRGDPDWATQLQAWHWLTIHGWKHQREISPCSCCPPYRRLEGLSILSRQDGAQPVCMGAVRRVCNYRGMLGWMKTWTHWTRQGNQTPRSSSPEENLWEQDRFSTSGSQEGGLDGKPQRANVGVVSR